jgi:NAD(P)-dependent dehydrogenase (short-subunit alcohol dehydrogenase family)
LPEPVVALTGAASGIGAACAARLTASGRRVIGVDLHDADVTADLGTAEGRAHAIAAVTELSGGSLAGLVTCAGLAGSPDRDGSLLAAVNYFGTVDLMVGLRPLMGDGASAVAISSNSTTVQPAIPTKLVDLFLAHDETSALVMADLVGSMATYPASKMAVAYWVRGTATGPDWAGSGIRLNAIAPGLIETPMVDSMRAHPETGPMLAMLPIPIGRGGRAEEIAALVEFLLGPDSGYFCGSVLFCDGGSDALLRTKDWPAAWDISLEGLGEQLTS